MKGRASGFYSSARLRLIEITFRNRLEFLSTQTVQSTFRPFPSPKSLQPINVRLASKTRQHQTSPHNRQHDRFTLPRTKTHPLAHAFSHTPQFRLTISLVLFIRVSGIPNLPSGFIFVSRSDATHSRNGPDSSIVR
jgi:hypothetical protein